MADLSQSSLQREISRPHRAAAACQRYDTSVFNVTLTNVISGNYDTLLIQDSGCCQELRGRIWYVSLENISGQKLNHKLELMNGLLTTTPTRYSYTTRPLKHLIKIHYMDKSIWSYLSCWRKDNGMVAVQGLGSVPYFQ